MSSVKEPLPKLDFDDIDSMKPYIDFLIRHGDPNDVGHFGSDTRNALRAIEAALNGAPLMESQ